jgi:hypothetical protein
MIHFIIIADILTLILPDSAFPFIRTVALAAGFPMDIGADDYSGATVADFHRAPCLCFISKNHCNLLFCLQSVNRKKQKNKKQK